jgi:hypothetical protein
LSSASTRTSIQALERAQGYLKLPDGRALSRHSRDYKRKRHLDPACCLRSGHRQSGRAGGEDRRWRKISFSHAVADRVRAEKKITTVPRCSRATSTTSPQGHYSHSA